MADHPHTGHRKRVCDRFESEGLGSFADHEALEILLFFAIPRQDVNPLSHRLVDRFGSLSGVLEAPREELCRVEGMTKRAALLVSMMLPLFAAYTGRRAHRTEALDTAAKLLDYARAQFAAESREVFILLSLDNRFRLIKRRAYSCGAPNEVTIHPRSLVEALLLDGASRAVFMHNHPSGAQGPSVQDRQYTEKLASALGTLGIELIDHIIVSGGECYSFFKEGDMHKIQGDTALKG